MSEEKEYDVVLDTLQQKYDVLWKMTQQNMNSDMFNIMDQIRFEQMDQITKAIKLWKDYKE
jgi:transcriptional regulator of heat shock response